VWIDDLFCDRNLVNSFSEWEALATHARETQTSLANHPLDLIEDINSIFTEIIKKKKTTVITCSCAKS